MFGTKILEEIESKYNGHIKVSRSLGFGTYIQAEGLTQSGGIVGIIWKPVLKKVKGEGLKVKDCLILGLGGGTVAKYVRLLWPNAKITGVDIDSTMIELGNKYLGLDRVGIDIEISDASDFLTHHSSLRSYDLVIVDLYKGDEFPGKFSKDAFLKTIRKLLTSNGTAVFNRLYYKEKKGEALGFGEKLKKIFGSVETFRPEANMMFMCKLTKT